MHLLINGYEVFMYKKSYKKYVCIEIDDEDRKRTRSSERDVVWTTSRASTLVGNFMQQRIETHIPSISAAVNVELDIAPGRVSMIWGRWSGQSFTLSGRALWEPAYWPHFMAIVAPVPQIATNSLTLYLWDVSITSDKKDGNSSTGKTKPSISHLNATQIYID